MDVGYSNGGTDMAIKGTPHRLSTYQDRYRQLARQLADIGYIASGSVAVVRFSPSLFPGHMTDYPFPPRGPAPIRVLVSGNGFIATTQ